MARNRPRPQRTHDELRALASRARYEGSAEHKVERWWGGLPEGRQMPGGGTGRPWKQSTSICPLVDLAGKRRATRMLRKAIVNGQFEFLERDRDFPSRVWYEDGEGTLWSGSCFNGESGEYKGWPLTPSEKQDFKKKMKIP